MLERFEGIADRKRCRREYHRMRFRVKALVELVADVEDEGLEFLGFAVGLAVALATSLVRSIVS